MRRHNRAGPRGHDYRCQPEYRFRFSGRHESAMSVAHATSTRSTRGASKQRRDQINIEIQKLRDLLPLSDSIKDRLFQLQVMSLACIFIRKHKYLPHIVRTYGIEPSAGTSSGLPLRQAEGCKALRGFLLMLTKNGKLLHISENASEYLGHSVEEIMCQGDSIYDLVDIRDHSVVQSKLLSGPPFLSVTNTFSDERAFICRMNLSRSGKRQLQYHKFVLVQGRYLHPAEYYQAYLSVSSPSSFVQPIFAAYCQPLINPENAEVLSAGNTSMFRSLHLMDMKFLHLDGIGVYHLGYRSEDLEGDSWYRFLHPSHLQEVSYKHRLLCQEKEGSVICLLRLQSSSGAWLWLHTVLAVRGNFLHQPQDGRRVRHLIHATYQLLSDLEATTLQANSWIYSVRQTFPISVPCKSEDLCAFRCSEQSPISSAVPNKISPLVTVKDEPLFTEVQDQRLSSKTICVEIPEKRHAVDRLGASALLTPDHSSPDSNKSFTTVSSRLIRLEEATEICLGEAMRGPLPELRDDLDEFFRAVEYSSLNELREVPKEMLLSCHEVDLSCKLPSCLPIGAVQDASLQSRAPDIERTLDSQTNKIGIHNELEGSRLPSFATKVKEERLSESGTSAKLLDAAASVTKNFLIEPRPCQLFDSFTNH
ncbi:Neuronal PAS domain-containing protein 4 [Toxocara canis]|uniref:Neuronal PAS domain-containing protein 4 n=2 Tax=Toxocara canis TaxID=6265 RepID=A0A0B2V6B4_TOXCA|nr:Neuronal PAS domain-containing protein 4 [Toxocara canis]VDM37954.1 unnamed protein product [Toxocara canis]